MSIKVDNGAEQAALVDGSGRWSFDLSGLDAEGVYTVAAVGRLAGALVYTAETLLVIDLTSPVVSSVSPEDGAVDVDVQESVSVTFSEGMDADTIDGLSFTVKDEAFAEVAGSVEYDELTYTATFTPESGELEPATSYSATVDATVTDLAGNPLGELFSWSFTTAGSAP